MTEQPAIPPRGKTTTKVFIMISALIIAGILIYISFKFNNYRPLNYIADFIKFFLIPIFVILDLLLSYLILRIGGILYNNNGLPTAAPKKMLDERLQRTEFLLIFILLSLLLPLLALIGSFLFPSEINTGISNASQTNASDNIFNLMRIFITILGFLGGLFVYFRWQDERFKKDIKEEVKDDIIERFDRLRSEMERLQDEMKRQQEEEFNRLRQEQKEEFTHLQRDLRHLVTLTIAERFEHIERQQHTKRTPSAGGQT